MINSFRPRSCQLSNVDLDTWQCYLLEAFPPYPGNINLKPICTLRMVPELDNNIMMEEIIINLSKCKNGKAPGPDEINYDFLKSLQQNWLLYMNLFFNKTLTTEKYQKGGENHLRLCFLKRVIPRFLTIIDRSH